MLEENDWDLLLKRIKKGECTPFLGSGACSLLGSEACSENISVSSKIVNEWVSKYHYPMKDSDDLTRVAQFVAVTEGDKVFPKDEVCNKITELSEEVTPTYFETPDEIHGVLADLPLPIYITTTYDDLMAKALKSRGREPRQEMCRWWDECLTKRKPTSSDLDPTSAKPLVYYLHGCYKIAESLVLTEDDYLNFLVAVSKVQKLLPPRIQRTFGGTSLLLIGYKVTDWDFRVLCRILNEYIGINSRKHISVQLVPGNVAETREEEAQKYLDSYFEKLNIQVYWHNCREFAEELKIRWEAFNRDITKINTENMRPFLIKEITDKVSILFLAADPTNESKLRLGEEFGEIKKELGLAEHRENFKLELPELSLQTRDITRELLNKKPQIVHFAGHGTAEGELCFEDETRQTLLIQPEALARLFKQFANKVDCVVLNACYSEIQAHAISKHIKYVIGMKQEIGDKAAIAFAIGFYQALGGGLSIEEAYKLGCAQIQMQRHDISDHLIPVLIKEGSVVKLEETC